MRAEFTEKQPAYKYMQVDEYNADVIIFKKFSEHEVMLQSEANENTISEVTSQKMYSYDLNIFRCNPKVITEEMISTNPESYLNYNPALAKPSNEERLETLETAFQELVITTLGGDE